MGRAARKRAPARFEWRQPPGAKAGPFPGFIEPCLATSRKAPPEDERWIHEIKFDGYRTQAQLQGGVARIYTRRGHDWTTRFAPIADALTRLPVADLILDGEVIVQDEAGVPDFAKLHADLARGRTDRLVYYAFDLLHLDGVDLRPARLAERKRLLAELMAQAPPGGPLLLSEHFEAYGPQLLERACALRLEGIVSKRRDDPYRSGLGESWIKTKCVSRDSFPIVAFVEKLGAKPRRIASLYLGRRQGGRILYAGKAQSGYSLEVARDVREKLDPYIRRSSPLAVPVKKPKATWVEPVIEAEVEYSSTTADGLLRAPVFKGLREDLMPRELQASPEEAPGFTKANILQLLPEAVVPSKAALERYWRKVGERALEHLARRPLKLVRHVHGTTFYHKGPLPPVPASVHQLKIEKREGGQGVRLWVDSVEGLICLVAIGAVELHPWNATVDDLEHADRLVIDLDPGEGVEWSFVIETALVLRAALQADGLDSWPKVTGGKGLHLMAPLERKLSHDAARSRCRALLQRFASAVPGRYTLSSDPAARRGRIFLDYLRNGRGNTAIGAWSPRARPGGPIARPVTWADVERGLAADAFTLASPKRARRRG